MFSVRGGLARSLKMPGQSNTCRLDILDSGIGFDCLAFPRNNAACHDKRLKGSPGTHTCAMHRQWWHCMCRSDYSSASSHWCHTSDWGWGWGGDFLLVLIFCCFSPLFFVFFFFGFLQNLQRITLPGQTELVCFAYSKCIGFEQLCKTERDLFCKLNFLLFFIGICNPWELTAYKTMPKFGKICSKTK